MPLFRPATGFAWFPAFADSIVALFREKLSRPFWLWSAATADLPTTSDLGANEGALAYDETLDAPAFYTGAAWKQLAYMGGGAALTKADDTNVTLALGGGPTTALLTATSLTLGWTGTLAVARGGTGGGSASGTLLDNITGFASTGLLARTGAGAYSQRTVTGTSNQITVSNGDGVSGNPTLSIPSDFRAPGTVSAGSGQLGIFAGDYVYRNATADAFTVYGTSSANNYLRVYGDAHATKAHRTEVVCNSVIKATVEPGGLCVGAAGSFGGGVGVISILNAGTNPGSNPTGGGVLYAEAGALKWRGSSGTVTTIAVA